jgi:hypothetical protein
MKKVLQILTAAVLSVSFIGVSASAQTIEACSGDITITNTGQGSNNTISCNDINTVVITCDNNINIATINYQNGQTGTATVTGNGLGGDATTGTVINTNSSVVDASASCAATASATPTPSTSPSPSTTPATVKPAALPNTAGTDTMTVVLVSLAAAAGIVGLSRFAVAAYNRFGNK